MQAGVRGRFQAHPGPVRRRATSDQRGNNLTAARKLTDEEWKGADRRRLTGLPFQVEFVDQPHGPNQSKKDSSVKENIKSYFPEFWFLKRVLWLSAKPFPRSDRNPAQQSKAPRSQTSCFPPEAR